MKRSIFAVRRFCKEPKTTNIGKSGTRRAQCPLVRLGPYSDSPPLTSDQSGPRIGWGIRLCFSHSCFLFFLLALAASGRRRCAASLRSSTQSTNPFVFISCQFPTRVAEPDFHLNCFLCRLFPPPSSFSSPPSLLLLVSHPIPSVFPYDSVLQ